jgi:hypothetical protein
MENTEIINKLEELITKTYEPILVIKMMRMPTIQEMEGFRQYLKKEFGYNSLIFPGEMETDVKLVSVLESEKIKIEDLQEKMNNLIERLESEIGIPTSDQE